MEHELAVSVKDLTYFYPDSNTPVLNGLSLEIHKGRFIVIMGKNGAGKSTLALCLNGIIPQIFEGKIQGEIEVGGKNVRLTRTQALAGTVGIVLQDPESQIIGQTVAEDTAFGPRNLGLSASEVTDRVQSSLLKTGLQGFDDRDTDELSGGEKQRLVLAGVLAMHQDILILDEPASELDPQGRADLYSALDRLRAEGNKTVIVIEHSLDNIDDKADEVIVLNEGKLAWQGNPHHLFANTALMAQYELKPYPPTEEMQKKLAELKIENTDHLYFELVKPIEHIQPVQLIRPIHPVQPVHDAPGTIVLKNLTHHYTEGKLSLDHINLEIPKGQFVALLGPNGAGKTTLTKHLNGLLKPIAGDVWVSGKNTRDFETEQLSGTVGYVFQNPDHQLFENSVEKELTFGLKAAGFSQDEIKARTEEILHDFDLHTVRGDHPLALGKSTRQLLTVATAIVLKPDILVIDEPTKGLDWPGVQKIKAVMNKLHQEGTTIIIITHDLELAAEAERIIYLQNGRLAAQKVRKA